MTETTPALARKVIPRNQVATSITVNQMRIAGMAVPYGMAVHQEVMTTIISHAQLHGEIVSVIKSKVSTVKSRRTLGEKACTTAIKRNGIEGEMTITTIKMIETGIHGTQDPVTMQPAKTDGTVVVVLVTTREDIILLDTVTELLNTDEPIALARLVDRPRRAAIVNRHVADAIST